jgi:hypothetical protein
MGQACTPGDFHSPPAHNGEHPIVAVLAIVAIVVAILLITWARVAVHGTEDIEQALQDERPAPSEEPRKPAPGRPVEDAVASGRFATGFSP